MQVVEMWYRLWLIKQLRNPQLPILLEQVILEATPENPDNSVSLQVFSAMRWNWSDFLDDEIKTLVKMISGVVSRGTIVEPMDVQGYSKRIASAICNSTIFDKCNLQDYDDIVDVIEYVFMANAPYRTKLLEKYPGDLTEEYIREAEHGESSAFWYYFPNFEEVEKDLLDYKSNKGK